MPKLKIAGQVFTTEDPESVKQSEAPQVHPLAILIEFEDVESLRKAVRDGQVKFKKWGE